MVAGLLNIKVSDMTEHTPFGMALIVFASFMLGGVVCTFVDSIILEDTEQQITQFNDERCIYEIDNVKLEGCTIIDEYMYRRDMLSECENEVDNLEDTIEYMMMNQEMLCHWLGGDYYYKSGCYLDYGTDELCIRMGCE